MPVRLFELLQQVLQNSEIKTSLFSIINIREMGLWCLLEFWLKTSHKILDLFF